MKDKERDLHVLICIWLPWALSTTETALTAHIVLDDMCHMEEAKHLIRHVLEDTGIHHVTLEFECEGSTCDKETC